MRKARERVIYDNYNIWDSYYNDAIEYFHEDNPDEEPSENAIWDICYQLDEDIRADEYANMRDFFDDGSDATWLLIGSLGRWNGTFRGGFTFKTFDGMLSKTDKDCGYFKFWDENGHFYYECSHHDGTNSFEVKKLTKSGERLLENWEYADSDDPRYNYSEEELHKRLWEHHSTLPHFAHNVYGCKKIDFMPQAV